MLILQYEDGVPLNQSESFLLCSRNEYVVSKWATGDAIRFFKCIRRRKESKPGTDPINGFRTENVNA